MPTFWLDMIAHVSKHIVTCKKSLLTMGIVRSIAALLYILGLEIILAILSTPLYLTHDYLKNPELFNHEGFSYTSYQIRKRVTFFTVLSVVFFWIFYGAFSWYEFKYANHSHAASNTISFSDTSTLYFDPAFIRVSGGVASLVTSTGGPVVFSDTSNAAGQFGSGTYTNTTWSSASSSLQLSGSNTNGLFVSRIMDAGATSTWQTLSWNPRAPYGKELPDSGQSESAYVDGNMNMTGLVALWHLNETSWNGTSGEVIDSSGNGYNATSVNGADTTSTAMFNRAGNFVFSSSSYARVATPNFQSGSQSGTVMMWVRPGAMTGSKRVLFMVGDEDTTAVRLEIGLNRFDQTPAIYHLQLGGQQDYLGASSAVLATSTWHHVAWLSDGTTYHIYVDGVDQTLSVLQGFGANSGDWFADLTSTDNIILGARRNSSSVDYFNGQMDEVAVFNRALSASEILAAYRRGVATLKYQVRSCDDPACSGETFIGPTGTSTSYYSELTTSTVGLPSKTLIGVPDNRYFQYQAFVSTTDATILATPELFTVTTTATVTSTYPTSSPSIVSGVGVPFGNIDGLTESLGSNNAGVVKYQLGYNNTSTWYYWNSSTWAIATNSVAQANSSSDITSHALTFDDVVGQGTVYVRAFLQSNGSQAVELSSVNLSTTSTVSFSVSTSTVNENVGTSTITLTLDRMSSSTVTVNYSATGGTAASSSDYTLPNGTATIPAGSTTTTIAIPIIDDHIAEGNETIILSLSGPAGVILGTTSTQTITILDNDSPGVTVTESGGGTAVTEASSTDSYTIVLNTQPTNTVTVAIQKSTSDVTLSTSSIQFTTSNWNSPVTVTVTAVDDSIAKGTRTVSLSHTASSTDTNYNGVSILGVTVTVNDNDVAGATVTESGGGTAVAEADATSDTYTIVLTSQPSSTVTIALATSSPDITLSTSSIQFTASNWNSPVTVTVTAVDDAIAEGTETSTISHTVTSLDTNYNGLAVSTVSAVVTDNDTAGVTVTETGSDTSVSEAGPTSDTYTVVLNSEPTATVTISLTTSGSGLTLSSSALSFTASNWNVPQTVTVTAVDDAAYQGLRSVTITQAASSADAQYNGVSVSAVYVDITDNDSATSVQSSGGTLPPAAFAVPLTNQPGQQANDALHVPTTVAPPADANVPPAEKTRSRFVALAIPADKTVKNMAIAYDPSFDYAEQIPYRSTVNWDLCDHRPRCRDGVYLVFIRVYSNFGVPSPTIIRAYELATDASKDTTTTSSSLVANLRRAGVAVVPFDSPLTLGQRGGSVRELQQILIQLGYMPASQRATGYFGSVTMTAIQKYQAATHLTVTGELDSATRRSLNALIGF